MAPGKETFLDAVQRVFASLETHSAALVAGLGLSAILPALGFGPSSWSAALLLGVTLPLLAGRQPAGAHGLAGYPHLAMMESSASPSPADAEGGVSRAFPRMSRLPRIRLAIARTNPDRSLQSVSAVTRPHLFRDLAKRGLDLAVAGPAVLFLAPIFLLLALAIRLDSPGPVIFRQTRRGLHGKPFSILKFRSMRVMENGGDIRQAKRNDDRVTRIGRIIRATSLDELPQLFNVLRGEMSLVGPRPHAMAHDDHYQQLIEGYRYRHTAKPGLTGWAQVHGFRGETPELEMMVSRVHCDIWYVKNQSFWLDIQILVRTAFELLRNRNVY